MHTTALRAIHPVSVIVEDLCLADAQADDHAKATFLAAIEALELGGLTAVEADEDHVRGHCGDRIELVYDRSARRLDSARVVRENDAVLLPRAAIAVAVFYRLGRPHSAIREEDQTVFTFERGFLAYDTRLRDVTHLFRY